MKFNLNKIDLINTKLGFNLKFPSEMSTGLAELIGIHLGDGSLYKDKKYGYKICYYGNLKKDSLYMNYISKLFFKLFNIKPKKGTYTKRNLIRLLVHSKKLFFFYKDCLKLPDGTKKNLRIPNYIKNNQNFLISFLRGLFDTDGCVTIQKFRKYKYPLIKISTKHKNFAREISSSLRSLDIPSFITIKKDKENHEGFDVVVRNKNTKKFFEIIGSNNPRNIKKFKKVCKI